MTETVDPKLREDRALLDLIGDKGRCRYLALSAIIKAADASMKSAATFPGFTEELVGFGSRRSTP